MKRVWSYLVNTFEVNTRRGFGKMLKIANAHASRLESGQSKPFIAALLTAFMVPLLVFRQKYATWKSCDSVKKSKTLTLVNELNTVAGPLIKYWQGQVFYHFPEGSPEARMLFPFNKTNFQQGSYEERISAVYTLSETLKLFEVLKELQEKVEEEYQLLTSMKTAQSKSVADKMGIEAELEPLRKELAKLLQINMYTLCIDSIDNLPDVARFFDLTLLRKPSSDDDSVFNYTGTLNAATSMVISLPPKFEMSGNANMILTNNSPKAEVVFFFTNTASAMDSSLKVVVVPGEFVELKAAEIGWGTGNGMLIAKNSNDTTADFDVMVAEAE